MTATHLCVPHGVPEHSDRDHQQYSEEYGPSNLYLCAPGHRLRLALTVAAILRNLLTVQRKARHKQAKSDDVKSSTQSSIWPPVTVEREAGKPV